MDIICNYDKLGFDGKMCRQLHLILNMTDDIGFRPAHAQHKISAQNVLHGGNEYNEYETHNNVFALQQNKSRSLEVGIQSVFQTVLPSEVLPSKGQALIYIIKSVSGANPECPEP